ncbi:hypothetical protein J437_LFUL018476 [Ladona fulva]|uniref:SEC63 domain-containing protein n=1 Tax=Ladona fulva TaxID=123851 RepID=A0A8K0KNP1_LADFU|nr:hypothetical protein J437_LFUL018476 [Ladona fulva]
MSRRNMEELFDKKDGSSGMSGETQEDIEGEIEISQSATEGEKKEEQQQQKKTKKGGRKGTGGSKKPSTQAPKTQVSTKKTTEGIPKKECEMKKNEKLEEREESEASENEVERSDSEDEKKGRNSSPEDEDTEWEKFHSKLTKREKVLEGRSKRSHSVHCPFFPDDKQEYWWVYICDRKSHTLLTAPCHITALVEHEEVQLKFTAPRWPGLYTFTVWLRSDSYLGFDQNHDIKLDVKEAPEVPTEHPQWDMSEEEEEMEGEGSDPSEFTTDEDVGEENE